MPRGRRRPTLRIDRSSAAGVVVEHSEVSGTGDEAALVRIGGVAHDLANLIMIVHSGVKFASGEQPHERRLPWLDTARLACARAIELVHQLTYLASDQELRREPLDPGDVFGDIVSLIRNVSSPEIHFSFQRSLTRRIIANRSQLGQVALNLIVNARDAVAERATSDPNYEPRVFVSQYEADAPRGGQNDAGSILLQVTDNGTGIPPELISRVFEPSVTTKRPGHASGLGLSTTRRIVTEHGGGVTVESTPGIGTTFTAWFPIA